MDQVAVTAALSALVMKLTDFIRLLAAVVRGEKEHVSAVITQAGAWIAGVAVVATAAASGLLDGLNLPGLGVALGEVNGAGQVLAGVILASVGSVVVDFKQSIDNTDSAAKPPLVKGP